MAVAVKEKRFDDLAKMIAGLQYGLLNLHYAPFPVVAAPFGMALGGKIAYIISGGDVRDNAAVAEDVILTLEREAFIDLLQQEKIQARIEHMLKTGKPLRN